MSAAPRLSVVVACGPGRTAAGAGRAAPAWLPALARSCAGIDAELLLVGGTPARREHGAVRDGPPLIRIPAPDDALVPVRWGLGLRAARGDVVAFTTECCRVHDGWARAALEAVDAGAAAVGGPLRLASSSWTDRAVHQLRFGGLPAPSTASAVAVHDVAADNAAYDRRRLLALGLSYADGFWEVEANRRLRARGDALVFRGDMGVDFVGGEPFWPLAAQRFAHGRQAGAWRVATGVRRRWQVVLAAPLVPLVLLARALRRAAARGQRPLAGATPAFLALATAWAAGEAVGAVAPGHVTPT